MPEWAQRFEHGFSQLVDWFWTLDSFKGTDGIRGMFEEEFLNYHGILIIGRSKYIDDYQHRNRLDWRRTKVLINSRPILCITYDELLEMLKIRVAVMQLKA